MCICIKFGKTENTFCAHNKAHVKQKSFIALAVEINSYSESDKIIQQIKVQFVHSKHQKVWLEEKLTN